MINQEFSVKRLYIRFEPEINDGTVFIFNKENGEMLEGDYYCYIVVKCIQQKNDINSLVKDIAEINNQSFQEVENNVLFILNYLSEKGFIS